MDQTFTCHMFNPLAHLFVSWCSNRTGSFVEVLTSHMYVRPFSPPNCGWFVAFIFWRLPVQFSSILFLYFCKLNFCGKIKSGMYSTQSTAKKIDLLWLNIRINHAPHDLDVSLRNNGELYLSSHTTTRINSRYGYVLRHPEQRGWMYICPVSSTSAMVSTNPFTVLNWKEIILFCLMLTPLIMLYHLICF